MLNASAVVYAPRDLRMEDRPVREPAGMSAEPAAMAEPVSFEETEAALTLGRRDRDALEAMVRTDPAATADAGQPA